QHALTSRLISVSLCRPTTLSIHSVAHHCWFLPVPIPYLPAALLWLSIFTQHGYLNSMLQDLHLVAHPFGFLNYNNLGGLVLSVVLAETWRSVSLVMVIVLSGVQGIPAELGEAAQVLGASAWRRFWHVT